MTKEELLALRQELAKLLTKGFIRVSKSLAGAHVLFAKKPEDDYACVLTTEL